MNSGRIKYFLAAIASAVIWGFVFIPLRNIQEYPAEQILYYRIFTSLIISWIAAFVFRREKIISDIRYLQAQPPKARRSVVILTFTGAIFITGNWFTFIYAVNNVSLQSAAFAYMVCPLLTAMGGYLILKEQLSRIKFLALFIALLSIVILAQGSFVEVLWSVFIASFYAFHILIQRTIRHIDKFNMLAVQLVIAAALMLPLYIGHFTYIPADRHFWSNILVIAVVFTVIPLFLSMYSLIGLSSSTSGIIIYVNPIVSFAVAFFYFGESVTGMQLFAYSLLMIAVIVFNSAFIKGFFEKNMNKVQA